MLSLTLLLPLLLPLLWAGALAEEVRFLLHVQEQVTVQEGQCVLVPCNVSYPSEGYTEQSPAYGYWFGKRGTSSGTEFALVATNSHYWEHEETRGRFHLVGDPRNHSCSLDIRDARREDAGTYVFRVERGAGVRYNFHSHPLRVMVTALTQTPVIQVPGTLLSGRPSNITCSVPWACTRGMPPTFSWMGVALPSGGTDSPVLSLTPGPQHHGTNLTCRVSFPGASVSTERTVWLSVDYAPQNVTIMVLQANNTAPSALGNGSLLPVSAGQSLSLACETHSNPAARLSWARGSLRLRPPQASSQLELELAGVGPQDEGEFTCQAQNPLGSQHVSVRLSLQAGNPASAPVPAENGAPLPWGVLVAIGDVALKTLLLLVCLVVLIVKSRRREAGEPWEEEEYAKSIFIMKTAESPEAPVSSPAQALQTDPPRPPRRGDDPAASPASCPQRVPLQPGQSLRDPEPRKGSSFSQMPVPPRPALPCPEHPGAQPGSA